MRRSFIGYSNAFPKLIQDLFGYIIDEAGNEIPNPNAPTCGSVSCGFLGECICAVAYMCMCSCIHEFKISYACPCASMHTRSIGHEYVYTGPLIGALIRPLGGWLSDKVRKCSAD